MKKAVSVMLALALFILCLPLSATAAVGYTDLVVSDLTWTGGDGQVKPGTVLNVTATVKNKGSAGVTAPVTVQLLRGTTLIAQKTVNSVPGGESVKVNFGNYTAVAGDYMMVAVVDSGKAVSESNERNNTRQRNLRVANDRLDPAYAQMTDILKKVGMTDLIFNDDFNDANSVDNANSHVAGYKWYLTRPYGAPDLGAGDYSVKNGIMTVKNEIPTYNYGLGTTDMDSHVGFSFNTGYLEVKVRIPRPRANKDGEKGVPAIWALPSEKLFDEVPHWVELDWLEYWGVDNSHPKGYYTICLHEQKRGNSENELWLKNSNSSFSGLGDGEWHVMGWLWQDDLFISYLDGKEVMRLSWSADSYTWPLPTVNKGDLFDGMFNQLDNQQLPIIIGGSQDNPMELEYVRVWDGNTTGTYVPPEKEYTPNTTVQMQMSADMFVYNFTTDAYSEPIKKVNGDNKQDILSGEATWKSLSADRRAEINALLKANGQPTFEALLSAAKKWGATGTQTGAAPKPTVPNTVTPTESDVIETTTDPTVSVPTEPSGGVADEPLANAPVKQKSGLAAVLLVTVLPIVAIVLAAVVVIAVVIVLVVVLVKKKKAPVPAAAEEPAEAEPTDAAEAETAESAEEKSEE